jgi:hypothetical protein
MKLIQWDFTIKSDNFEQKYILNTCTFKLISTRKTKKYHTVGTIPKSTRKAKKYHTVGTIPKSDIKIVER